MTLACVTLAYAEPPPSNYLPPQQERFTEYLPPQPAQPLIQYGPPAFQRQTQQYNAPQQNSYSPSASYNAPQIAARPSSSYGAPGNGGYSGNYETNEPARYNFEYNVQDYQSGNDFGHKESRDGDLTTGRYYVLLPDGRKQVS